MCRNIKGGISMEKLDEQIKNTIILFIKFGQKEHLEDLQKGNLYMNNYKYFIDLEKQSNNKGRGDEYESFFVLNDVNVTVIGNENNQRVFKGTAKSVKMTYEGDSLKPVFCLMCLTIGDLQDVVINRGTIKGNLIFSDEQKEKIEKEFGDYALLISPKHLINAIDERFTKEGIVYRGQIVQYSDFNKNYIDRIESCMADSSNKFFWKDKSLEYQKEYRIVILNKETEKPFKINIGNIKPYTKLTTTKELLNDRYSVIINNI